LDRVLGDPLNVSAAGRTLASIALDVAHIATQLRAVASSSDWSGAAARSAHTRSATLPPKLDKAHESYAAAAVALCSYARSLEEAQQQSESAIASASRAGADLSAARAAQAAASAHDASAAAAASAAGVSPPPPTAGGYQGSIEDAAARLSRALALNDQAHELQREAARVAARVLHEASHDGIRNASWMHRVTHSVGHWASTHWAAALHEVAKVANVVSALAGLAALVLAVAGVLFPPLEIAAAVLETVSLVSAAVAGMADTALAVTGRGSWKSVGIDAIGLAPAGLGKVITKAAPILRESRLITPRTVVHASSGDAVAAGSQARTINYSPTDRRAGWGLTPKHLEKHFFGSSELSLSTIDPGGSPEVWVRHLQELATMQPTATLEHGIQDVLGRFQKSDGSGSFTLGIRIAPRSDGTFDLVTVLTRQADPNV
jgi:hypothetical protein